MKCDTQVGVYFYVWMSNCSSTVCVKGVFPPLNWPLSLCQNLADHICVNLFLGSVLSIDSCIPPPVPRSLHYCSYIVSLWSDILIPLTLFLFSKIISAILIHLSFYIHFRSIFFIRSYKTACWDIFRILLNLNINLGIINIFIILSV